MKVTIRRGIDILMLEKNVSNQLKEIDLVYNTVYCLWNSSDLFPSRQALLYFSSYF